MRRFPRSIFYPFSQEIVIEPFPQSARPCSSPDNREWNNLKFLLSARQSFFLTAICCWVTQLGPTLCDPMDCIMPGFPVHHQLPEFTQTHVHWVSEAIQPSHPLLSPFPPAFNLSQHQGQFFASGGQSIGVSASASVLPMNIQDWFPLRLTGWISLQSKGLSRIFSNTTVQKHQFFNAQSSLRSNSHICTWLLEKPQLCGSLSAKWCLCFPKHCRGLS